MLNDGWIRLHRQIQNHWLWKDPVKLQWWIDILITVNHSPAKVNIGNELIDCNRGESVMSLLSWASRWKVSKDTARNFLKLLEKDNMIVMKSYTKTTRITVCKYDSYQTTLHDEQTITERSPNADQTLTHTNNKNKNNNKEKKDTIIISEDKPSDSSYKLCMEIYNNFVLSLTGVNANINSSEGKALKLIISYLDKNTNRGESHDNFKIILDNYSLWDKFHQNQIKLLQINSNLINIINSIKNGRKLTNNTKQKSAFAD